MFKVDGVIKSPEILRCHNLLQGPNVQRKCEMFSMPELSVFHFLCYQRSYFNQTPTSTQDSVPTTISEPKEAGKLRLPSSEPHALPKKRKLILLLPTSPWLNSLKTPVLKCVFRLCIEILVLEMTLKIRKH